MPKYAAMGYSNVIKTQWACNHFSYRKLSLPLEYDVSFVGQPHGSRKAVIEGLVERGIKVNTFGLGWESGRVTQDDMIRIFNQSRINLNLSNASVMGNQPAGLVRRTADRVAPLIMKIPFTKTLRQTGNRLLQSMETPTPAAPSAAATKNEQIKGRNFEVPGCGGFVLTGSADNLEDYYVPGKEIACFNYNDLADKIRYYLSHEEERADVADAGYRRTMREHTYVHRFQEIFERMRLPIGEIRETPAEGEDIV
jgi:spore maturation protein CgeB